jgi:hypothetical protein
MLVAVLKARLVLELLAVMRITVIQAAQIAQMVDAVSQATAVMVSDVL